MKMNKLMAEFIGTLWLVLGGCGSAVLAAGVLTPGDNAIHIGIGLVGVFSCIWFNRINWSLCFRKYIWRSF